MTQTTTTYRIEMTGWTTDATGCTTGDYLAHAGLPADALECDYPTREAAQAVVDAITPDRHGVRPVLVVAAY